MAVQPLLKLIEYEEQFAAWGKYRAAAYAKCPIVERPPKLWIGGWKELLKFVYKPQLSVPF